MVLYCWRYSWTLPLAVAFWPLAWASAAAASLIALVLSSLTLATSVSAFWKSTSYFDALVSVSVIWPSLA